MNQTARAATSVETWSDPSRPFDEWSSLRYYLRWAYSGRVVPGRLIGVYDNYDIACWLILKGSVILREDERTIRAHRGQWVFLSAPSHYREFSRDAELISIHFHLSWPDGEPVFERKQCVVVEAVDHPRLEREVRPIVRIVRRHFPKVGGFLPSALCSLENYLEAQSLLPAWLAAYVQTQLALGQLPRRLKNIDQRVLLCAIELDRMPLQDRATEEQLARKVGLSRAQLNILFVRAFGTTPRRYFERRKIESAEQLLLCTETSVKEIAYKLGFRHPSYFCSWFLGMRGKQPSVFRREKRNSEH